MNVNVKTEDIQAWYGINYAISSWILKFAAFVNLDDNTQAVWRRFYTFEEVVTSYFNSIGFGYNAVYPWNSSSVLWTQTVFFFCEDFG